MSSIALDDAAHAHGRGTLEEGTRDNGISAGNGVAATGNGEDTIMDTLDDLADAGLDSSLVAEVGDILAGLANDDASLLGGDNSAERQLSLSVFLVRLRGGFAIRAEAVVHLELIHGVEELVAVGGKHFRRRHRDD